MVHNVRFFVIVSISFGLDLARPSVKGQSRHAAFSPVWLLISRLRSFQIGFTLAIKTEKCGRIHWTKVSSHTFVVGKESCGAAVADATEHHRNVCENAPAEECSAAR
jgi:hypothetical protein